MLSRRLLRIKVIKTLYAHFKSESDSMAASEKTLLNSIDKTYDLYFQMLYLIVDVARYARERIELARNKKLPKHEDLHPNLRFVNNAVIRQLEDSEALNRYIEKRGLGWVNYPELIKNLYNSLITKDYYREYMNRDDNSYRDDVKLVTAFYLQETEDNEALEQALDEQSILWNDDLGFALIMVVRTLSECRARQQDVPVLPQFKSDDDLRFAKELFRSTLAGFSDDQRYIEKYTDNWDVERLAFLDNIILATAMTELTAFDSIPVKVTMDEYIEISKYYSTPGSSVFINGVLDKVVASLTAEGRIQKTGRGLL